MIIELPASPDTTTDPLILGLFFFPNNNLAIRKACAAELGGYDEDLSASEDVDICFRLASNANWVASREKSARVRHHPRSSFLSFIRQMWWWGWELGKVYKKTGHRGVFCYWVRSPKRVNAFECSFGKWFPCMLALFITDFHLFHFGVFAVVCAIAVGSNLGIILASILTVISLLSYSRAVRRLPLAFGLKCKIAFLQYCANLILISAAFLGGVRQGVILLPASIFRPTE